MKKRIRKKFEKYLKECSIEGEEPFTNEGYMKIICGVCNINIYEKCKVKSIFDCPKGIKGILKNEKREHGEKAYKESIKLKLLKKHNKEIAKEYKYIKC